MNTNKCLKHVLTTLLEHFYPEPWNNRVHKVIHIPYIKFEFWIQIWFPFLRKNDKNTSCQDKQKKITFSVPRFKLCKICRYKCGSMYSISQWGKNQFTGKGYISKLLTILISKNGEKKSLLQIKNLTQWQKGHCSGYYDRQSTYLYLMSG